MAIILTDFDKIWASSSPLTPYSFSDANYEEGWNFVGSTPPARQMWDGYMKWSDEKQQWIVNNFLPLAGGTMTGSIVTDNPFKPPTDDTVLGVYGGTDYDSGSALQVFGKDNSTYAGWFSLRASDGINNKIFIGKPDGTLTWNNQKVHNGNSTSVWSSFTPSESQFGAIFVDVGFAVFCNSWQGANITRSAGALLFTIDSDHLPAYDLRVPFVYNTGATVGVVKIEASTGKVTVDTISSTSAQGRLTMGGFMWVKGQSLW